ncbi:MAG TPA: folylpolyglutamate synthase/dihydrofolate synthase family protein [Chloroflexota bacterium]|nr:folylpolyglutamate synthase/dihydrofolate synthase family protein [Chloroflexota bacterium]
MEVAKQQRASVGSSCSLPPDADETDLAYRAALDWVWSFSARPRSAAEMAAQRAIKLERMGALLAALDHPERGLPSILVAGTKGKGSTVAMIAACTQAAGLTTGRYTSPHLINWRERTVINGQPISTTDVVTLAEVVRRAVDPLPDELGPLTTFEVGTALTFLYFARASLDIAVVEVGTGGRFDATNMLDPLASVITPISYDHTPTLGETLSEIAWHKAGVMRTGRPAVSAPQVDEARLVIEREAATLGTHLEEVGHDWWWTPTPGGIRIEGRQAEPLETAVGLLGAHQRDNATAATGVLRALGHAEPRLRISATAIQTGLANVEWPGRLQILGSEPLVVVDGAHNAASADVLRSAIEHNFRFARLHLVLGLSAGKDARGVLHALAPRADTVHLTRSHHERSAEPSELESLARSAAPTARVAIHADVGAALAGALAGAAPDDLIVVTGSLFLVGETLVWWRRSHR